MYLSPRNLFYLCIQYPHFILLKLYHNKRTPTSHPGGCKFTKYKTSCNIKIKQTLGIPDGHTWSALALSTSIKERFGHPSE